MHYAEGCAEMEKACFQMFFRRTVAKYFILQQFLFIPNMHNGAVATHCNQKNLLFILFYKQQEN